MHVTGQRAIDARAGAQLSTRQRARGEVGQSGAGAYDSFLRDESAAAVDIDANRLISIVYVQLESSATSALPCSMQMRVKIRRALRWRKAATSAVKAAVVLVVRALRSQSIFSAGQLVVVFAMHRSAVKVHTYGGAGSRDVGGPPRGPKPCAVIANHHHRDGQRPASRHSLQIL